MNNPSSTRNPFIYGRPVQGDEFIGRQPELSTIFNRLRNCESTAVVGEPHIGKSSLLLHIANEATQSAFLGDDDRALIISSLDLHPISNDYTPRDFWDEALSSLHDRPGNAATARQVEEAVKANYSRRSLERLFNHLSEGRRRLVLLLDEFERLLIHPNFNDPSFFALTRSLSTRTGGLAIITASRLTVTEMNERGRGLLDTGSPFFNNVIEVRLRPFDQVNIDVLLDRAGDKLSADDRRFVRRLAGKHPYLLQATAAALLETTGAARPVQAAERLYERISFHFDDLWSSLDERSRTTAVILGLMELGGRAQGRDFAFGEIERVAAFGPELRKLAELGWAEQAGEGWQFDWEHLLLWHEERWTMSAQACVWWVRDVAIAETRAVPKYADWLANKQYRFLLTEEQWNGLTNAVRNMPDWAVRGVGGLARSLFEELTRHRT